MAGDTSCLIQSFQQSSIQQGDPVICALTESVSFGRFVTETLEWDKWSNFNQNRYLEEAKRFSKPGLVAQKKALFEAHFKKIAADKAAAAALREMEASKSSAIGKPCVHSECVKLLRSCSADAVQNSSEADGSSVLDISSQCGKAYCDHRNDSRVEVSVFVCLNNSDDPANSVQIDEPISDFVVDTNEDLEQCDKKGTHYDSTEFNPMVVEPSSFPNPPDGVTAELDELDRSEVLNNSNMLLGDPRNKNAAQEPVDQFVAASDGRCEPILPFSKTLASATKPAVKSNLIPPPPDFARKEKDTTRNTRPFGSAMLNKERVTTKALRMSVKLDSGHLDFKRPLDPKKVDSAKGYASSVSLRGSRVGFSSDAKERPGHVSTNIGSRRKQAAASDSLSTIRKSSAELYIRHAPSQQKRDNTLMNRDSASMRHALDMRKSKTKLLHKSFNLDSHVGEKERLVSLRRTGNTIDATINRTSTTKSAPAPTDQMILDQTMRRKQKIIVSNSSADVRKMITQFHAKPAPPMHKDKHNNMESNTSPTLSQVDKKKSVPKSPQMLFDLSSTARKPTVTQVRGQYCINASTIRASKESTIQVSLKESSQSVDRMKDSEKCPPHKMDRPETPRNLIRPPSPTVSKPFQFRSDKRAAIRKEILEEKCKVGSENSLERKGKFPLSRPQSPRARKTTPGKARETKNCKPPQTSAKGKAGLHQVTENKISTTYITLLPRKTACENASPNIKV